MPSSIVGVPTAIPAFVGYAEKAADPQGKSLYNRPVAINSLDEYRLCFGGGFNPLCRLEEATAQGGAPTAGYDFAVPDGTQTIQVTLAPSRPARFILYNSIRLF